MNPQNIHLLTDSIPIFLGLTVEQFSRDSVASTYPAKPKWDPSTRSNRNGIHQTGQTKTEIHDPAIRKKLRSTARPSEKKLRSAARPSEKTEIHEIHDPAILVFLRSSHPARKKTEIHGWPVQFSSVSQLVSSVQFSSVPRFKIQCSRYRVRIIVSRLSSLSSL